MGAVAFQPATGSTAIAGGTNTTNVVNETFAHVVSLASVLAA